MRWKFCNENEFVFLSQHFSFENVYVNYLHFSFCCLTFSLWTKVTKTFFWNFNLNLILRSWTSQRDVMFMRKKKFFSWWEKIKWFRRNANKTFKNRKRIHWESKKKTNLWTHYVEKAIIYNETSKMICTRCTIILSHLAIDSDNTIITHHLSSSKCKKTFIVKELKQLSLKFSKRVTMIIKKIIKN
jgi:hypothetical protein